MLNHPTLEKLRQLKLTGMVQGFADQLSTSSYDPLSFEERLGLLVDLETNERENRRLKTRLTQAKLRQKASIEDIDFATHRGLDRSLILSLANCKWITEGLNLIVTGPTGIGKSYLACAMGHKACLRGFTVKYFRVSRLFSELRIAEGDGSYPRMLKKLAKTQLLILDDWGLKSLNEKERNDLMEIIEDRHGITSTLIAAQLPIEKWHQIIGNPTIADAILDRIVHNAHQINLNGESMRKMKKNN